jgi:DNA-binding transcriptional MerR regulator
MEKSADAFRTIGEVSEELGLPQHILRYWETRFPQLKPMQRAGNRRYYRPDDVALVRRIHALLNEQGYTVKGVQKLLAGKGTADQVLPVAAMTASVAITPSNPSSANILPTLLAMRDRLARALAEDDVAARV